MMMMMMMKHGCNAESSSYYYYSAFEVVGHVMFCLKNHSRSKSFSEMLQYHGGPFLGQTTRAISLFLVSLEDVGCFFTNWPTSSNNHNTTLAQSIMLLTLKHVNKMETCNPEGIQWTGFFVS